MADEQKFQPTAAFGNLTTRGVGSSNGPSDSFLGSYFTRILIGKYERPNPFTKSDWSPDVEVRLPLPTSLADETSVAFNTPSLGAAGDLINGQLASGLDAAKLRAGVSAVTGLVQAGGAAIGNVVDNIGSPRARAAKNILGGIFTRAGMFGSEAGLTPENLTSAIQEQIGLAPNPNPSVQFDGPELRTYSYTWPLYPRNKDESKNIQDLIKLLKQRALPSSTASTNASVLNYPDLVQVNFFPWDGGGADGGQNHFKAGSFIRYKKSFMAGVSVRYNPYGTPAFFEGSQLPVTYQLTIIFKEAEYMLSDDWGDAAGVYGRPSDQIEGGEQPEQTATTVQQDQVRAMQENLAAGNVGQALVHSAAAASMSPGM